MFMSRLCRVTVVTAFVLGSSAASAEGPKLGKPLTQAELAAWDLNIMPDGTNLPPGSGTHAQGAPIYAARCAACHGANGEGQSAARLVGGAPPKGMGSSKNIATHWPYATTVFDYVRRAMPHDAPRSLSNDDYYALVAWILAENDIIDENAVMNAKTLPAVRMPSVDRFVFRYPTMIPSDPERVDRRWLRSDVAADGVKSFYRLRPGDPAR